MLNPNSKIIVCFYFILNEALNINCLYKIMFKFSIKNSVELISLNAESLIIKKNNRQPLNNLKNK